MSINLVTGTAAVFTNINPDVMCVDNNSNSISLNVTEYIPALNLISNDTSASIYLEEDGKLNITPYLYIDTIGNMGGEYIDNNSLAIPYDDNTLAAQLTNAMDAINENGNLDGNFSRWIYFLQNSSETYNAMAIEINDTLLELQNGLLDLSNNDNLYDIRIVVATYDGTVYYDTSSSNNSYDNALNDTVAKNQNTKACVMTVLSKNCNHGFERNFTVRNSIVSTLYSCAKGVNANNVGLCVGTVVFSINVTPNIPLMPQQTNKASLKKNPKASLKKNPWGI